MAQFCLETVVYGFQNSEDNAEHTALSWFFPLKQLDFIQNT